MKFKNTNQSKGFTIIETLIVLAIAATIFLVVFLAVSALDRSSRNTGRKDDAAALLAAIGDYASDNNGALPTTITAAGVPTYALGGPAGTVNADVKLSHYTAAGGTAPVTINTTGGVVTPANDSLIIDENSSCASSSTTSATITTGAYAVIFNIESGSGWVPQCLGS